MQVLPVIDLKDGKVVRGVAGQRATYQPVESLLASDATASSIANAFAECLPVDAVYVADLDAIAGAEPNWQALDQISETGLQIWLDAGVGDLARAEQLSQYAQQQPQLTSVIMGLESVPDAEMLSQLYHHFGREQAVFSLDLKQGVPLSESASWQGLNAEQIASQAIKIGFQQLIVLDLAAVGMDQGTPVEALCQRLSSAHPDVEWISGGGIRGPSDLKRLAEHGCSAALVASALHDGRLTADHLNQIASLS